MRAVNATMYCTSLWPTNTKPPSQRAPATDPSISATSPPTPATPIPLFRSLTPHPRQPTCPSCCRQSRSSLKLSAPASHPRAQLRLSFDVSYRPTSSGLTYRPPAHGTIAIARPFGIADEFLPPLQLLLASQLPVTADKTLPLVTHLPSSSPVYPLTLRAVVCHGKPDAQFYHV
jgi:hypothetical protein